MLSRTSQWLINRRLALFPAHTLRGRFAGNVSWTMAGLLATNVAGMTVGVVVARQLGKTGYGELGIVMSTYGLFSQLGNLGLHVATHKYVAEFRRADPARAGRVAGMALVATLGSYGALALVVLLGAPLLASYIQAPGLVNELRGAALVLLFMGFDAVQNGILAGLEAFNRSARITMLRAILNVPVTILAARWFGVGGVVGALLLLGIMTVALNRRAVRQECLRAGIELDYRLRWPELKPFLMFAIPSFLAGCLVIPVTWLVNTLLVRQPGGYAEMGLFNAANQWRAVAIFVPSVFNSVFISVQASLHGSGDQAGFERSLRGNLKVQGGAAALVGVGLVFGAPLVMRLYGKAFDGGDTVLAWLALSWFFLTPCWLLWNAMMTTNQVWRGLGFNLFGAVLLLVLAYFLVGRGAHGLAMAFAISGAAQAVVQGAYYFLRTSRLRSVPSAA